MKPMSTGIGPCGLWGLYRVAVAAEPLFALIDRHPMRPAQQPGRRHAGDALADDGDIQGRRGRLGGGGGHVCLPPRRGLSGIVAPCWGLLVYDPVAGMDHTDRIGRAANPFEVSSK